MPMCSHVMRALLALAVPLALTAPAQAHDTWVIMKDYAVKPASVAVLTGVSDHKFVLPPKEAMPREKVEAVSFSTPAGAALAATPDGTGSFASTQPLKEKGTYVALLKQQPGFYSKTPDGGVPKNKKEAQDIVDCRFSLKHGKAIFTVGASGGTAFSQPLGVPMELVPLQDPTGLKVGSYLEVRVLLDGKPVPSTMVFGTYAGFSEDNGAFAYTTSTNKEGIARIKLLKAGPWLLLVKKDEPYRDPSVCDRQAYAGSLTFRVR